MNVRRLIPLLVGGLVVGLGYMLSLGSTSYSRVDTHILYAGTDTTWVATKWFAVKGAEKVVLRTRSGRAAWALTGMGTDSTYTDSIGIWHTLFSDSVSFIARDSLGTLVTARSSMSSTKAYPMCADSILLNGSTVVDTAYKHVFVWNAPVNRVLRAPASGSGILTYVLPYSKSYGNAGAVAVGVGNTTIDAGYMRVRFKPTRTLVWSAVGDSAAADSSDGIKNLRIDAEVYYR